MTINFKDEYATLRQEMLERFDRIHDTAKYGTGAFIAFLAYYYTIPNFDNFIALTILQLIVALVGMTSLRLYQSIYVTGTYIAVIIEDNSEAKWHRMSRQVGYYEKKSKKDKLPFPLGKRWGADSAQLAIILMTLMLLGFGAVILKATTLLAFQPLCALQWFLLLIILFLSVCNVIAVHQLWWGMHDFMQNCTETWKKYRRSFGSDFADTYSELPPPESLNNNEDLAP